MTPQTQDVADVEALADAILTVIEQDLAPEAVEPAIRLEEPREEGDQRTAPDLQAPRSEVKDARVAREAGADEGGADEGGADEWGAPGVEAQEGDAPEGDAQAAAGRESAARESAARESAARESAARESAARESAAQPAPKVPEALLTAVEVGQRLGVDLVRRYNRLEIDGDLRTPPEPTLFVANHGFGSIFDLNVFAIFAALEALELDRPVTILTHQVAWTLRVGPLIEQFGATPASMDSALAALARGEHVLVLPGGDIEAFKPFSKRDEIVFEGRTGFARLALAAGVPIVGIVTAGAGESAYVISDGQRLARALRIDKTLRTKVLPVTVTIPWGVSIGLGGVLPFMPLPTKLLTAVLPPITAAEGEEPAELARRVEDRMQQRLTELAVQRKA